MARFKFKILLESLRMPIAKVPLQGGFLIRDVTGKELKAFQKTFGDREYYFQVMNYERIKTLEKTYEFPLPKPIKGMSHTPDPKLKAVLRYYQENEINLRTILLALRLIKPGTLGYRLSLFEPLEDIGDSPSITQFTPMDQQAWGEGEYRLEEGDIKTLQRFWRENCDRLFRLDQLGALQIAISRFEMSYHKYKHVDKFLDLMMAMEALYLAREENMELSYRMSQRAALMLESDKDERIKLRNRIRKLYRIRSKLIHGGSLEVGAEGGSESDVVLELKDYVRQSIRKFLPLCKDSKSIDKELKKLDDEALD